MQQGTLINEPIPTFVTFYYYYSFLTLFLSWFLAPLLFYVILTQSKNLGKFKWLIFNYSFWSLFLTTMLGIIKPLIFLPAAAGIQIGIFRDILNFKSTIIFSVICLLICGICFTGLFSTLAYRYLLAFPSPLTQWLTLKKAFIFTCCFPIVGFILVTVIFLPTINISINDIHEWAHEYDIFLEEYFEENTFFTVPYHLVHIPAKISLAFLIIAFISEIFILAFLNYQMKNYKTKKSSKTLNSLILSSVIQILVSLTFFITPCILFFVSINFQIPYTTTLYMFAMSFMMSHCFIDFLVTLYFIVPYRKFIFSFFVAHNNVTDISNHAISVKQQINQ